MSDKGLKFLIGVYAVLMIVGFAGILVCIAMIWKIVTGDN